LKILYVSNSSSDESYKINFENKNFMIQQQSQKYHRLFIKGLFMNKNEIFALSSQPKFNRSIFPLFIGSSSEKDYYASYYYLSIINIKLIRNFWTIIQSFFFCYRTFKINKIDFVVCDTLSLSNSIGAVIASKILNIKVIGILTDIPGLSSYEYDYKKKKYKNKSFNVLLSKFLIRSFDFYVFLTEHMNELLNKKRKPYIVSEGYVDITSNNQIHSPEKNKIVIMYAGSLSKLYGIDYLIGGFLKANISGSELHIYGDGDYKSEIIKVTLSHPSVKYFGTHPNETILEKQRNASLLVNPRTTNETYTKYSFPSKNLEYMISGTPVLTTQIPGMPKEYYDYVFLINEETIEGMSNELLKIFSFDRNFLIEFGNRAKKFVYENKNNVVQTSKIIASVLSNLDLKKG
jgi:glycosyltransferase involved in cell wall biosynthesis